VVEVHHFATWSRELFGKSPNKLPHFDEEKYEIVNLSSFEIIYLISFNGWSKCNRSLYFLLVYLSCSYIWLNLLVIDHHIWCHMKKLRKREFRVNLKNF
jgi:hypothetical protein